MTPNPSMEGTSPAPRPANGLAPSVKAVKHDGSGIKRDLTTSDYSMEGASRASCTADRLAPSVKAVTDDGSGIKRGFMTSDSSMEGTSRASRAAEGLAPSVKAVNDDGYGIKRGLMTSDFTEGACRASGTTNGLTPSLKAGDVQHSGSCTGQAIFVQKQMERLKKDPRIPQGGRWRSIRSMEGSIAAMWNTLPAEKKKAYEDEAAELNKRQ